MQYFLLILFGFFIGCLIGGMLTFIFIIKKKVELKKDQKEYLEILQRHNKIEKELAEYKNEFNNKYVNDEYDAY
tara:strand:+ start:304 stop:525 length:222 start_codon:yes stop_codon:yes gene_type:complete